MKLIFESTDYWVQDKIRDFLSFAFPDIMSSDVDDMISAVAEQFDLPEDEAKEYVADIMAENDPDSLPPSDY